MCLWGKFLEKTLAITVLLLVIQGNSLIAVNSYSGASSGSSSDSPTKNSPGNNPDGNHFSNPNNGGGGASSVEEENFYPFTLSQSKIANDQVAGIRIRGEKI
jgi:hypothetical protein